MRLVMMGTGPFAVPTFRSLIESHHAVLALVTGALKEQGKRPATTNPMREVAAKCGTPIFDPESVNAPPSQERIGQFQADLLVVCDYGQILSTATLAQARLGGINLHASLLPKYRGAAPINWALWNGEKETGVSVIHMTPQVDAGPVIAQGSTPIDADETAVELEARLAQIGAWLVRRAIDSLESGTLEALPQSAALASKAARLKKSDGAIDWNKPALSIKNQIRALEPWPKTYTYWYRPGGPPLRLIAGPAIVVAADPSAPPGCVLEAKHDRLLIATPQQALQLTGVQPAGKRMLSIAEFLRGYHVMPGERFGPAEEPSCS
jgi:methionyl-tRNA formyltransferase